MKNLRTIMMVGLIFLFPTATVFSQMIESQRLHATTIARASIAPAAANTTEQEFGAVPALTAVLGKRELVPNITVLGAKNFNNGNLYATIRAFTGSVADMTTGPNNASTLFINEASKFGFTSVFSYPVVSDKLAVNLGVNFLGKALKPDSVTTVSSSIFQGKIGLECVPLPRVLSVYINFNTLTVADHVKDFETYYTYSKSHKSYIDFGARLYLDIVPASNGFQLFIDLNFIAQNGDVKGITKNDDPVIPIIKVGIKKSI